MLIRVLDTETTGLDPALHRICEIATVDITVTPPVEDSMVDPMKQGHPTVTRGRMWSSLVNPGMPIPPEASAVHDITDEMVAGAPSISDLILKITDVHGANLAPDYFCAHNSRFDQKFINPVTTVPWFDTYRIALWLWPDAPNHKNSTLRYYLNLKLDPSVVGDVGMRNHRALWDAYVTAAIFRRAIMSGATIEDMLRVSSEPAILPRLGFGEHAMKPLAEVPTSYLQWIVDKFEREREDERHTALTELARRRKEK